jgi:hypothetical protein
MQSSIGVQRDGLDAKVNIPGKPSIKAQFFGAGAAAGVDATEIKIGIAQGFLQLQGVFAGQKYPRHMGLNDLNRRANSVGAGVAQEAKRRWFGHGHAARASLAGGWACCFE